MESGIAAAAEAAQIPETDRIRRQRGLHNHKRLAAAAAEEQGVPY